MSRCRAGIRPSRDCSSQPSSLSASSTWVITPRWPWPRWVTRSAGAGSQPVARRTAPAESTSRPAAGRRSMASTGHASAQAPQKVQRSRSMERSTRPSYTSAAIAVAWPAAPGTEHASSQSPQSMHSDPTMVGRVRTSMRKSPPRPVTDWTSVRRRMRRLGWSTAALRKRHFLTPGWAPVAGRQGPQSPVGKTGPMAVALLPGRGAARAGRPRAPCGPVRRRLGAGNR